MVKKIVALSIAFVLMLAAPLYDVITAPPASPVDFGAGDGTSLVIESPEKLNELLSNIPNIETYLETNDMTTVNQNFKSFTMVEDGFSKQIQKFGSRETETYTQHVLEMCFAVDALYYHAVGTNRVTESVKNDDDYVTSAERTTTEYDMEIYYSKDKVLLKLNTIDYLEEEKKEGSSSFTVKEDDKEPFSASAQMSFFKKCAGKWLELKEYTPEELSNKLGISAEDLSNPNNMSVDAQYSYAAYMYANEFANANIRAINQSNQMNVAYLAKLGGYIVEKLQTSFTENGDTYYLKNDSASKNEYANAIIGGNVFNENNNADIEAEFSVGSTESSIYQQWELSNGNNKVEMEATTTFKNLDNTVVNLKEQKITTVYEALKGAITDYLKEMSKEVGK
jgi:hypothetical protein